MIDGHETTRDWERHAGDTVVWGIGSFEQHSRHLPLCTDALVADYFARMIAEHLDGALLPTLDFGTSLEQTGFRGTITLRPETLMQVVRDVAGEVESQGFSHLVILNGHGGNHCLAPVVRDINRVDRDLKILLVHFWEHCDPAIARSAEPAGPDLHAGEWETSLMLALHPEQVGEDRQNRRPETDADIPLEQKDLTTFGIGHLNPDGSGGYPTRASRDKGRAIVASIRERMLPYVRDRLARLRQRRRYAGTGGLVIRAMRRGDIDAGMRLKEIAGWNQQRADWEMILDAGRTQDNLVTVRAGRVVGTTTALPCGRNCAWIGMVLVDPEFRRLGIATRMLRQILQQVNCETVRLDATPAGRAVYRREGFAADWDLERLTCRCLPFVEARDERLAPANESDMTDIVEPDREVFGYDRGPILARLRERSEECAWKIEQGNRLRGFCLGRPGTRFHQIGPVIAHSVEDAIALIRAAMQGLRGRPVVLDVPHARTEMTRWLSNLGFVAQRTLTRMTYGDRIENSPPRRYFAIAGPELG
jgi:creatinine amidohydrolase/Fe(II)-dependent formamide hydrolase-like protein/GNAT superfamily N-acetyltransferase